MPETTFPKYQPISMVQGIVQQKCPRCRTGKMFKYPTWSPVKFHRMHPECPHCDFHFEIEPGFWYGAMYVSYAINTAVLMVMALSVLFGFPEWSGWTQVGVVIIPMLSLIPINFRISRVIYLYLFGSVKYDPKAASPVDIEHLDVDFTKRKKRNQDS